MGRRLRLSGSGDDAAILAGEVGVGSDRSRRREVQIALERYPEGSTIGGEFREAHVVEFRFAEADVPKTEGQVHVGVEFREEPGGVPVGRKELRRTSEIDLLPFCSPHKLELWVVALRSTSEAIE